MFLFRRFILSVCVVAVVEVKALARLENVDLLLWSGGLLILSCNPPSHLHHIQCLGIGRAGSSFPPPILFYKRMYVYIYIYIYVCVRVCVCV